MPRLPKLLLPMVLVAAPAALAPGRGVAQEPATLRGVVRDAVSGRPLGGVEVRVASGDVGRAEVLVRTDERGRFQAELAAGAYTIHFSLSGYATQRRRAVASAGNVIDIEVALERPAAARRVTVWGEADSLVYRPARTLSEMLAAREPGLVVLPSGGLAGDGARVRIRGLATMLMSNQPDVYVDGIRVDLGEGSGSRLDDLNPEVIERIEVLKGPAAAGAVPYGADAKHGVIQVFTKRGRPGGPRLDVLIEQGVSSATLGRIQKNAGFARDQARANSLSAFWGSDVRCRTMSGSPCQSLRPFEVFEVDYYDRLFDPARQQAYALSLAGGTAAVTYFASGRWAGDAGPLTIDALGGNADDADRKTQGVANLELRPRDNLRFRASAQAAEVHHEIPTNNGSGLSVLGVALTAKPERATAGNPEGSPFPMTVQLAQNTATRDAWHHTVSFGAQYAPFADLTLDATVGTDVSNQMGLELVLPSFRAADRRDRRALTLGARLRWDRPLGQTVNSTLAAGWQRFATRLTRADTLEGPAGLKYSESHREHTQSSLFVQEQVDVDGVVLVTGGIGFDRFSILGDGRGWTGFPNAAVAFVPSALARWTTSGLSSLRIRGAWGKAPGRPSDSFALLGTFVPITPGVLPDTATDPQPETATEIELGAEAGLWNDRIKLNVEYWDRRSTHLLVPRLYPTFFGFTEVMAPIGQLDANGWELEAHAMVVNRPQFSLNVFANGAYLFQRIADLGGAPPMMAGGSSLYRNFLVEGQAPGVLLGAVIMQPCGGTSATRCLQAGQLPYDTNLDGVPDTREQMEAYFAGDATGQCNRAAGCNLELFNSPIGRGPLLDDRDGDGDFLDNCLADRASTNSQGKFRLMTRTFTDPVTGAQSELEYEYCLTKSTPDWSGSFGADLAVFKNLRINALFEYKVGNFYVVNLTDGFRNANRVIGRNTRRAAELEAIIENPTASAVEKTDALIEFHDRYNEGSPYSGLNLVEKADFLRWRELSVTYHLPRALARSVLGLRHVAFNVAVRNAALWTAYGGINPEAMATGEDGALGHDLLEGVDAWGAPLPRRFTFSVRFGF